MSPGWEAMRLTPAAKSLHRKDAAPAQHGAFQTWKPLQQPQCDPRRPRVPSCARAALLASPCPEGRGSRTLPVGGGPGRGTARRWRALTQALSVWGQLSLGILSPALAAEVPQLSALGGECTHWRTLAGWLHEVIAPRPETHTHSARVPCFPATAAWNLTRAELHCTARKEMEPHRAGWRREEGRLGPHPASQLYDLRASPSACQKGERVLRPGKTCVQSYLRTPSPAQASVLSGCCCRRVVGWVCRVWARGEPQPGG